MGITEARPWGCYEILHDTDKYKTKLITVNPGQRISLQYHHKREEHWLIVAGQGVVYIDAILTPVVPGTCVHIPLGARHRIENTGTEILQFLELQLGTYFGEDDIVRIQDDYNRDANA